MQLLKLVYKIEESDLNLIVTDMDKIEKSSTSLTYIPAIDTTLSHYKLKTEDTSPRSPLEFKANTSKAFHDKWTLKYDNQNVINLSLSKNELFKKSVYRWYTATKPTFKPLDISSFPSLKTLREQAKPLVTELEGILLKRKGDLISDLGTLKLYNEKLGKLLDLLNEVYRLTDLSANKTWVMSWLWYGGKGMPRLNPFDFGLDDRYSLADTSGLPALRLEVFTKENFLKSVDYTKVTEATVEKMIKQISEARLEIGKQLQAYYGISEQKANNKKLIAEFATTSTALNKLSLIASISGGKHPVLYMRHHDALNAGVILNPLEEIEYLESDRVFILTHNLSAQQKAAVTLKYATIENDQSPMTEIITSVLKEINNVKGVTFGGRDKDKELLQLSTEVNKKIGRIKAKLPYLQAIEYVLNQENPNLEIKEVEGVNEIYHTQRDRTPKMEGSVQATYTVSIADESKNEATGLTEPASVAKFSIPADTFRYRINKLYRIFPMAGIAYTLNDFGNLPADASNSSPGLIETEKTTHFFVGLKVYLKKIDIRNTNFIAGRDSHQKPLFWTRTHIDVGFDLADPLRNIFTGAGIDPWTGISVNFGAVWNRYDYFTYAQGIQSSKQRLYRPGFYIGLSTDITLFAQIAKLLSLSK